MSKKLYIGGLSYATSQENLENVFGEIGGVLNATIISDHQTGRSKGFGFVEMSTMEEASAAINKFNGTQLDGRTITVNEARERSFR